MEKKKTKKKEMKKKNRHGEIKKGRWNACSPCRSWDAYGGIDMYRLILSFGEEAP